MTLFIHIPKNAGSSIQKASGIRSQMHKPLRWVDWVNGDAVITSIRNPYDRIVSVYYYLHKAQDKIKNFKCRARRQSHKISHFNGVNEWISHFHKNQDEYRGKASDSNDVKFFLWQMESFFHQQINYLNEADGEPVSDRITDILRYETLEDDWAAYALLHDLPPLQHKNKSELRPSTPWQEELSAESIAKIGELYADDFEHLNYERIN